MDMDTTTSIKDASVTLNAGNKLEEGAMKEPDCRRNEEPTFDYWEFLFELCRV
jgi:hypothetical protein